MEVEGVALRADLMGGEELVGGCWTAGKRGREVEEVFEEDFYSWEGGGGGGCEFGAHGMGPCSLRFVSDDGGMDEE